MGKLYLFTASKFWPSERKDQQFGTAYQPRESITFILIAIFYVNRIKQD